jgi:outer membrane protein
MNTHSYFLISARMDWFANAITVLRSWFGAVCLACLVVSAQAQEPSETGFKGDVGLGWLREETLNSASPHEKSFIPYVYGDWGPWFARVDTFGIKTMPMGWGHLEVVYRNSGEGKTLMHSQTRYKLSRDNPQLWGLGTFQETSVGGFFLYGLHDQRSNGQLLELTYALEFPVAGATLYPQFAIERRSANYVNKLYGVSATEAAAAGLASYKSGATNAYVWGLALEVPLQAQWNLDWELSHTQLGSGLSRSPWVNKSTTVRNLIALVRHF